MSESSLRAADLPVAVDDPRAIEVVGRQLDPHAVPGQDADPEAAHLARHVAEVQAAMGK